MLSKEEPFENFTSDALCLHDLSFFSAELTCGISLVNFGLGLWAVDVLLKMCLLKMSVFFVQH